MEQIVGDIPGVACYLDDIVVTGKCEAEHLANLQKTLEHLPLVFASNWTKLMSIFQKQYHLLGPHSG